MKLIVDRDFDVEGDCGRSWGIELHQDGSAVLYLCGLREDSDAIFTEDQRTPMLEIKLTPEQAVDVLGSLETWLGTLHGRS
jgi:hypothetical protein